MSLVREEEEEEGKEGILSLVHSQTNQEVKSLCSCFYTGKGRYIPGSATSDKPAPVSDSQSTGMFALLYKILLPKLLVCHVLCCEVGCDY